MQPIPESIQKITTEVPSDKLSVRTTVPDFSVEEAILLIKKSLDSNTLASFETGLNFYKTNISNEKLVVKNYNSLFSECFCAAIKKDVSLTEQQNEIIKSIKSLFDGINLNFEAFYDNLFIIKKQNNILDVKDFTFIILGYAISLIKKIHNSRN